MAAKPIRLRRARSLVFYWQGSQLIIENYLRRMRVSASLETAQILQYFSGWRAPAGLFAAMVGFQPASVRAILRHLIRIGFLLRQGTRDAARDAKLEKIWSSWLPAAGHLHYSARDTEYFSLPTMSRLLRLRAKAEPPPSPVKHYPGAPHVPLPAPKISG